MARARPGSRRASSYRRPLILTVQAEPTARRAHRDRIGQVPLWRSAPRACAPYEREVGYWIGREHWGRGVATAALAAFVAEVTERPLFAHVVNSNAGSIRVLEKCGFRRTGDPTVAADGVVELLYRLDGTG